MLKLALIVGVTLVVAALIAPLQVAAVTEASSPRIWIHAQFYSGGMGDGPPDPWELTIASCGDAMQQTFIFLDRRQEEERNDLKKIHTIVSRP